MRTDNSMPGNDHAGSPAPVEHHDHGCARGCAAHGVAPALPMAEPPAGAHTLRYRIEQMDCPTEERLIRDQLQKHPAVAQLHFNLLSRELTIVHGDGLRPGNDTMAWFERKLTALGMTPVRLEAGSAAAAAGRTGAHSAPDQTHWWRLGLAAALAAASEAAAWWGAPAYSLLVGVPALLAILLAGIPTLHKGWIALRHLTLNIHFLMSVAILGAVLIRQWPEAAMVIVLFSLSERIEAMSLARARRAIQSLMSLAPEQASVQQADGSWRDMAVAGVPLGAVVRVRPGERIALDGVVLDGSSAVNQAPITGESVPVDKDPGDAVFAATINESGVLTYRVTARQGETTLARIVRIIEEAQAQRAPTQRFIDRFARIYTPAVVLFAGALAVLPPLLLGVPALPWIYKALVMLVIACPCALVISTPVTIVSGLTAAARAGILIKGGVFLENGRQLKAIAMDKTGTLTRGAPQLARVVPLGDMMTAEALQLAASLDANSTHPIARAIVAAHAGTIRPVSDFANLPGQGVGGTIDGVRYHLGNHRLAQAQGACDTALETVLSSIERQAQTAVVLVGHGRALAVLAVADRIRDTSRTAVARLQQLGVHVAVLTGDNRVTAETVAREVGIDDVQAGMMPEDKLKAVDALRAKFGPIGMVGDGINDAPALARADVGFAMGASGTDTAMETADVTLMNDDLLKLPEFVALCRRTAAVLKQNIAVALGIKALFFALALAGAASLWMAVFADVGASLLVIANGLRLLRAAESFMSPRSARTIPD